MSLVGLLLPSLNVDVSWAGYQSLSEEDDDCEATGVMRPEVRSEEPPATTVLTGHHHIISR